MKQFLDKKFWFGNSFFITFWHLSERFAIQIFYFFTLWSSINDVTQMWTILNPWFIVTHLSTNGHSTVTRRREWAGHSVTRQNFKPYFCMLLEEKFQFKNKTLLTLVFLENLCVTSLWGGWSVLVSPNDTWGRERMFQKWFLNSGSSKEKKWLKYKTSFHIDLRLIVILTPARLPCFVMNLWTFFSSKPT